MSHELRTPLNSIIGFTGMMLRGLAGDLSPEQERQLKMIRQSGHQLLALVEEILDLTKLESGPEEVARAVFDPSALVRDVADQFRLSAEESELGKGSTFTRVLPRA